MAVKLPNGATVHIATALAAEKKLRWQLMLPNAS